MAKTCFYEVLGVSRTATDGEMKSAFRKAAMQYHPDRNPGNAEAEVKFKELNEAYQTLTDGQKRSAYDRFGHAAFEQGGRTVLSVKIIIESLNDGSNHFSIHL